MWKFCIYSTRPGATAGFVRSFVPSAGTLLPTKGKPVYIGAEGEPVGALQYGIVKEVKENVKEVEIKVGTDEGDDQDLREILCANPKEAQKEVLYTEILLSKW